MARSDDRPAGRDPSRAAAGSGPGAGAGAGAGAPRVDHARGVYVISVAAELAGMHPQTLRIYERRGLVRPARTQGGNRRYSERDIQLLRRIQELAAEGMNLEGIRRTMQLEAELERMRAENDELRLQLAAAEQALGTREPRRDLVPLRQAVAVFTPRPGQRRP